MKNQVVKLIPALIWMCIIFYFSSRPTAGVITEEPGLRFIVFKSFHLIEYAILSGLLFFAIGKYKRSVFYSYFFALTDEIHQYYVPGRMAKLSDTFIDLIGICLGLILVRKIFYTKS